MTRYALKICWNEEDKASLPRSLTCPAVRHGAPPKLMRRTKRRAQLLLSSKQRGPPVARSLSHPSLSVDS
jgi:hypothetical protein